MAEIDNEKFTRLAKSKVGHMIMTKTLNLLPLESAIQIAEQQHDYKNLIVEGPGISDFDQITLGFLANKMFTSQTLAFEVTSNEILDFHQIPVDRRYEYRKRAMQSIDNLWKTSFSFDRSGVTYECRIIYERAHVAGLEESCIVKLTESFANLFDFDNFGYSIHPAAYKSIHSFEARKLFRVLLNFRYKANRRYSFRAKTLAYSMNLTEKAANRANEIVRRAFESLIDAGLVEQYDVENRGAKAVFNYTLSKNFAKFSEEMVAEKAELKIKKETEKSISEKVSKISDSFSIKHLESYVPDTFFSDELFDTNEIAVKKSEKPSEENSYDWVNDLAWQGQLKGQWSAGK